MPKDIFDQFFTTHSPRNEGNSLGNIWDLRRLEYPHLSHMPDAIFKAYCNFQDAYNRLKETA